MSAAETLRGRRVRRNVDEKLLHAIFDVRQILFMRMFFVCGMNLRSLHGTERMRGIILCGTWMFPAFWRKFLFEFTLFLKVLLETRSLSLDKRQSHGPGHKSTVVNRESIQVVTQNSDFLIQMRRLASTASNNVRLHVEALKNHPCPSACASQRRQRLLATTHMRRYSGQRGHKSTDCTQSVVPLYQRFR